MKWGIVFTIAIVFGIGIGISLDVSAEEGLIPSWIKSTASFWVEGDISDSEFISALQFLVTEGTLVIPAEEKQSSEIIVTETKPKESVTESSVFPDPEKDPRYYLKRYYTESTYKDWYDSNFPNITIEDKVGYPSIIVSDDAYANSLFGFSFIPPSKWEISLNPSTLSQDSAGIVEFYSNEYLDCDYGAGFIVHYDKMNPSSSYESPESLLEFYEYVIYWDSDAQTKLVNKEIEQLQNGHKISYYFNTVTLFPEIVLDNGVTCPEEYLTSQFVYVIFLYNDGDMFSLIYGSEPIYYEEGVSEFEQTMNTFKTGSKFEKLKNILNYDK